MAPPTIPTWASNGNFSGGIDIGTPTKVDPAGLAADGYVAGQGLTAQHTNWLMEQFQAYLRYVDSHVFGAGGLNWEAPGINRTKMLSGQDGGIVYNSLFTSNDPWLPGSPASPGGLISLENGGVFAIPIGLPATCKLLAIGVRHSFHNNISRAITAQPLTKFGLVWLDGANGITSGKTVPNGFGGYSYTMTVEAETPLDGVSNAHGLLTTLDLTGLAGGGFTLDRGPAWVLFTAGTDLPNHVADYVDLIAVNYVENGLRTA